MASAFTHALASIALKKTFYSEKWKFLFWYLTIFCSVFPDADVISFKLGIQYGDFFGHRGFFHSILFALILGFLVTTFFFKDIPRYSHKWWQYGFYFSGITMSHIFLDGFTNGGLGVAYFSPFDTTRYFFPWRPIEVSGFQIDRFFTSQGMFELWLVLKTEFVRVWIPSLTLMLLLYIGRRLFKQKHKIIV